MLWSDIFRLEYFELPNITQCYTKKLHFLKLNIIHGVHFVITLFWFIAHNIDMRN